MLVGQTARIGRQVCWSVKQLGWVQYTIGRYVGLSNSWGRWACMFVRQTVGLGRRVCWLVKQLG